MPLPIFNNTNTMTDSLSFACAYKWIKDWRQGLEVNTAVKTMLGMKNKCCVNVKVCFEIVRAEAVSVYNHIHLFQLPLMDCFAAKATIVYITW